MSNFHLSSIRGVDSGPIRGRGSALTSSNHTKRKEEGKREKNGCEWMGGCIERTWKDKTAAIYRD
jgi:hypothetical protein